MQGFNMGRYYAPSTEHVPTFNTSSHPLGARARKLRSEGVLVVRFELPFAVWCDTCSPPAIIGQGVRFNAEKKKVGMYHSTPIWEFAIKHTACGGRLVIRTDPRKTDYVVESGGRRRDYGERGVWDGVEGAEEGEGEILTPEERQRRKGDAMAALEGRVGDKEKKRREEDRVEELRKLREKDWADPYAANRKLRKPFREVRKERLREEGVKEELKERFGLGLDIVEEREEDRKRARLIEFGVDSKDGDVEAAALKSAAKPLFEEQLKSTTSTQAVKGKTKAERAAEMSKQLLQQKLKGNTRAAMDPFSTGRIQNGSYVIAGLKRKRTVTEGDEEDDSTTEEPLAKDGGPKGRYQKKAAALVDYDSEDE